MTLLLLTGSAKAVDPDAPAEPDVGALEGVPAAPLLRRGQEEGGAQRAGLQGGQRERGGGPSNRRPFLGQIQYTKYHISIVKLLTILTKTFTGSLITS